MRWAFEWIFGYGHMVYVAMETWVPGISDSYRITQQASFSVVHSRDAPGPKSERDVRSTRSGVNSSRVTI